jgi:hypothetical protein
MVPTAHRISTFRLEVRILHSFSSEKFRLSRFRRCSGALRGLSFLRSAKNEFQVSGFKVSSAEEKGAPGEQFDGPENEGFAHGKPAGSSWEPRGHCQV